MFFQSYDAVWRAAQIALRYPISINVMETGQLETDWVRMSDGFQAPGSDARPSAGTRFRIVALLVKGMVNDRPSVRVTLTKVVERQKDFFSEPERIESDGLEERLLMYRIQRELVIEEAIRRAARKSRGR